MKKKFQTAMKLGEGEEGLNGTTITENNFFFAASLNNMHFQFSQTNYFLYMFNS